MLPYAPGRKHLAVRTWLAVLLVLLLLSVRASASSGVRPQGAAEEQVDPAEQLQLQQVQRLGQGLLSSLKLLQHEELVDALHHTEPLPDPNDPLRPLNASEAWIGGRVPERAIMLARWQEDISWLDNHFNIQHVVFNAGLKDALHPVHNDGANEASTYLTYILKYWNVLPNVTFFSHASRCSWHAGDILQLIPHLNWDTPRGYANVRYSGFLGADNVTALSLDPALRNASADALYKEGYSDKFKSPWDMTLQQRLDLASRLHSALWGSLFEEIAGPLPAALANPCCSTFLVKRDAILLQPRAFYQKLLNWLDATTLDKHWTGRIFESTWQVMFGEAPTFWPQQLCEVFKCDKAGHSLVRPKEC